MLKSIGHTILLILVFMYAVLVFSAPAQKNRTSDVLQVSQQLRAICVNPGDPKLPLNAIHLQKEFKQLLKDIFIGILNENPSADPINIKQLFVSDVHDVSIESDVHNNKSNIESNCPVYGFFHSVAIEKPEPNQQLLAVTVTVSVMCGEDTSLYLFEKRDGHYKHILTYEAPGYQTIDKAYGMFQYKISPADKKGKYFILAAHVNPWCTSNWQKLSYVVLQPSHSPGKPKVLLRGRDSIYIGVAEPIYRLNVTRTGFSIDFAGEADSETIMKPYHIAYIMQGVDTYKFIKIK